MTVYGHDFEGDLRGVKGVGVIYRHVREKMSPRILGLACMKNATQIRVKKM